MLESIIELTELFIISISLYLIYKLLNDNNEKFINQIDSKKKEIIPEYKVVDIDYQKNPPNETDLRKWIKQGFYLDDGNKGFDSPFHNKCSPLCCKKQKYVPEELQPKHYFDKKVSNELNNYVPTDLTCMDMSFLSGHMGNASCMCLPKNQVSLIKNRGYVR